MNTIASIHNLASYRWMDMVSKLLRASGQLFLGLVLAILEVFELLDGISDESALTRNPVGRTNNTMFISVLEGADETKYFIHTAANLLLIDADVAHDPGIGNNDQTTMGNAFLFNQTTIVLGDSVRRTMVV
eukprot:TRINITY_DN17666_c0_g1_i1.p1 TRINITY_DN17666_c0_g1~~TRINITY_DN17666_c0_g1_i1.p1  ORF type:complete len:131 (+),score=2.96 TRINITY_DN17666_c0_g1_i1:67-459(+)